MSVRRAVALCAWLAACQPAVRAVDDASVVTPDASDPCGAGCPAAQLCAPALGCVDCLPGAGPTCGADGVYACNPDGTLGAQLSACADDEACADLACVDACAHAADAHGYEGCEYWAVDLDNIIEVDSLPDAHGTCAIDGSTLVTAAVCSDGTHFAGSCDWNGDCTGAPFATCQTLGVCADDAQHAPFAIVVSNPDDVRPVHLALVAAGAAAYETDLAPGEVRALLPQALGFADQSIDHSGIAAHAYRVTTNRPVVAYQFNPLDDVHVFSNDASLLLPRHTFGQRYLAIDAPSAVRRPELDDWDGTLTVVAPEAGETVVTVTPTQAVRAGDGVPALAAGVAHSFHLHPFETLNLEGHAPGDLTGTLIESDRPVSVWAGHEATALGATCCADHLEDQLFPMNAWGQVYALARAQPRAGAAGDLLRILAQRPGTTVTFDPPVATCPVLDTGGMCEVVVPGDVLVSANQPILVAHFLMAAGGLGPNSGDPALSFAIPAEQQRRTYTLLVPDTYFNNYLSIVTPVGGHVLVDGVDRSAALTPFASARWAALRLPVAGGRHRVACSAGCGVEVYGWAEAVSYLYAAGLDVKVIVP